MNQMTNENPIGTNGFEFVEFAAEKAEGIQEIFEKLGFVAVAKHKTKNVTLYRQGDINFILNEEANSFSQTFSHIHGPSASAMAFRVDDAEKAHAEAIKRGAENYNVYVPEGQSYIPAIKGIGDSLLYFVDKKGQKTIYETDFDFYENVDPHPNEVGLFDIDHLTHNVYRGHMDEWYDFYVKVFNFHEIRFFDIQGEHTGLISRALSSPCGKIRIPINESRDDQSQIEEYLKEYNGEGIQHIALTTKTIYNTIESLRKRGVEFLDVPDTYYDMISERLPENGEDIKRLQENKILIDGEVSPTTGTKLLLQIFTKNVIGPIFFEIIQRKGDEGFGEGNFQALFEAIERDQIARGVIQS